MTEQKTEAEQGLERVKLWDPLLRVFHWALVFCVVTTWILGEFGPNTMTIHFYLGYAVIGLLAFRIIWGLIGPASARFSHFIYGPKTTIAYVKTMPAKKPSYWRGHNPVGALSVFAILGLLMAQVATGLFVDADDFINVGPFAHLLDSAGVRLMTKLHHQFAPLILILVLIHVGAIVFYKRYKGENLVTPMITGWKLVRKGD